MTFQVFPAACTSIGPLMLLPQDNFSHQRPPSRAKGSSTHRGRPCPQACSGRGLPWSTVVWVTGSHRDPPGTAGGCARSRASAPGYKRNCTARPSSVPKPSDRFTKSIWQMSDWLETSRLSLRGFFWPEMCVQSNHIPVAV